ncbi:Serine arginine-rich splicing factor 2 [Dionaea muscipula]
MFGVVKDVFIPRKKSKIGKRFGIVRYDCLVAASVAIQKTNGIWIQGKELKVKVADFDRVKGGQMKERLSGINGTDGRYRREGMRKSEEQGRDIVGQDQK